MILNLRPSIRKTTLTSPKSDKKRTCSKMSTLKELKSWSKATLPAPTSSISHLMLLKNLKMRIRRKERLEWGKNKEKNMKSKLWETLLQFKKPIGKLKKRNCNLKCNLILKIKWNKVYRRNCMINLKLILKVWYSLSSNSVKTLERNKNKQNKKNKMQILVVILIVRMIALKIIRRKVYC